MADGSIKIDTKLNRKGFEQGLKELQKDANQKVKQLEQGVNNAGNEVNKLNEKFSQTSQELSNVEQQMDAVGDRVYEQFRDFDGAGTVDFDKFIEGQIQADSEYQKLKTKQIELNERVEQYKSKLDTAKGNQNQLNVSLGQAKKEQAEVNAKLEEARRKASEYSEKMKGATAHSKKVSVENLGISKNIGGATKKLAKFGIALLGFRGIYSLLKGSMNEWLNGSSKEAKQLQADINNIKGNIGAALAPAIQSVLQIFYKILAVVGAIVKAFSNINIFAKHTAKSTASTAKNSKQASNNLASFDKLDVLNQDTNSDAGAGEIQPTDLTSLMGQYEELATKIKDIFSFILEPFKQAWETTGQEVINSIYNAFNGIKSLCVAVGSSFAKIWTNGTVQTTAELLLKIFADILDTIGNIAKAFANAWKNNGNGDKIVQALADAFNNLLSIIEGVLKAFEEWTSSQSFQAFANAIIQIIQTLSGWFEIITGKLKEIWENGGKETFTKLLEFIGKIVEVISIVMQALDPVVSFVVDIVGGAIQTIVTVLGDILDGLSGLLDFIIGIFTGDWEKAWEGIKTFAESIWKSLLDFIGGIGQMLWDSIVGFLDGIKNSWNSCWQGIGDFFSRIWEAIKSTVGNAISRNIQWNS